MGELELHRSGKAHHRKTQRDAGSVGEQRHGRIWKILSLAVEAEYVTVKRERRIQILYGVDGVRKALNPGLGLIRSLSLRQGDEGHRGRQRDETKRKREPHNSPCSRRMTGGVLHQLREYIATGGSERRPDHARQDAKLGNVRRI